MLWNRRRTIFIEDGVHAFYLNAFLRNLFVSLTSIFTPIFLYGQTLNLYHSVRTALLLVVLYYVIQRIAIILALFPLSHIIERIGFRHSVAASIFFLIAHTAALILTAHAIGFMWAATLCLAIQTPLYWLARDSVIAQDARAQEIGKDIANLDSWEKIAQIVGPFLGGLLVSLYGYSVLYATAGLFLVLSIFPLWKMHSHTHKNGVSVRGFWYWLRDKRFVHVAIGNAASAINDYSLTVVWPLILFFRNFHEKTVGIIFSVAAIVGVVEQYVAGRWFDTLRRKGGWEDEAVFSFASISQSVIWTFRLFVRTLRSIVTVDLFGGLVTTLVGGFFSNYLHLGGKRMGSIAYWVYAEVVYSLGSLILFALMAVGIWYGVWKEIVLLSAAWWSLVAIVMARESNMR